MHNEISTGKDAEIKAFAEKDFITVQQQLNKAKAISESLKNKLYLFAEIYILNSGK